ncbi:alpha/beta fold hydrolase [Amycolatopsis sp. DSM 110486]|uniref:alpha/beta fold hydrolase n=1 Tax=Amycolatopsis sp. DSM 110486 TaxID=2865832 RepID=UPI001C69FE52|nr:alpha/beta hydrolase [Amycolatopsis sp. DSM 110486]QYN18148.1 alpha/beta hydrolase [Amycolatopsis sp. DSM 110486]
MISRRAFGKAVGAGAVVASLPTFSSEASATPAVASGLGPVRHVRTDLLDLAYHEVGPARGDVVLLGHGWPYSPHAYAEVAPALAGRGYRVLVPYLRGHGATRFRDATTMRSGQQAALGADLIAFLDALGVESAVFGGYDWGGRALDVAAALWPRRCRALVSVNSYLIQNLDPGVLASSPDAPGTESAHWYFYFFLTERGHTALTRSRRDLAEVVWRRNSPQWRFTSADLDIAAAAMDNPDYVDVVIHNYRVRQGAAPGDPRYAGLEARLLAQPPITVPAVTLDGLADGSFPATDGTASAKHFTGPRVHHRVPGAGHNLPQEKPRAFVDAVLEAVRL